MNGTVVMLSFVRIVGVLKALSASATLCAFGYTKCAKKVVSDSSGLEDFPVRLLESIRHLPDGQVKFLGKIFDEIETTEVL